jgi:hypothetical protein
MDSFTRLDRSIPKDCGIIKTDRLKVSWTRG